MLHTITHRASHNSLLNQYTYGYDETFNITIVGSKTDPQSTVVNHSFTYDAVDRIKTSTDGSESYDYDNRGNRLTMQSDRMINIVSGEYKYNVWGQLTEVITVDGTIRYAYDPAGLLYERTDEHGNKNRYYYLNGQLIAEGNVSSSGTATLNTRYVYGRGIAFQMDASGQKAYYFTNGHGDVVELRSAQGQLQNEYEYDIWGNTVSVTEARRNLLRYSGEYWDDATGLQYLRARWYDPSIGRFITEDTYEGELTSPLTLNLYTYVLNNPKRYVDSNGKAPRDLFLTEDEIAIDFGLYINSKSIEENVEYGSHVIEVIVYGKTYYTYNEPFTDGKKSTVNISKAGRKPDEGWNAVVSILHTHSAYDNHLSDVFSNKDYEVANSWSETYKKNIEIYVVTPQGKLKKYDSYAKNETGDILKAIST